MDVETVFARQVIGRLAITAILAKDFPLGQGIELISAVDYVVINLLVRLSYSFLDPRIHYHEPGVRSEGMIHRMAEQTKQLVPATRGIGS